MRVRITSVTGETLEDDIDCAPARPPARPPAPARRSAGPSRCLCRARDCPHAAAKPFAQPGARAAVTGVAAARRGAARPPVLTLCARAAEDGGPGSVQFAAIPGPAYVSGFRSGHVVPELNTPQFSCPAGAVPNIGPIPGARLGALGRLGGGRIVCRNAPSLCRSPRGPAPACRLAYGVRRPAAWP